MAAAAQVVEGMGADIVDVNMGCPVPKIAKHTAGCSLMRDPELASRIVERMVKAVRIPVTVKMRAGWSDRARNASDLARRVQDAGAAAVAIHGRTAEQSYSGTADWSLVSEVAEGLSIPVLGSGDCIEPQQIVDRLSSGVSGVLVGRGVLRNPWILRQAADLAAGRPEREVTLEERGRFLSAYIDMLLAGLSTDSDGFRHVVAGASAAAQEARGRERWVVNKLRALCSWYSKGLESGSHLRVRVNAAGNVAELREIVDEFFTSAAVA
jgi:tRNA-dihydrouridine synthase B